MWDPILCTLDFFVILGVPRYILMIMILKTLWMMHIYLFMDGIWIYLWMLDFMLIIRFHMIFTDDIIFIVVYVNDALYMLFYDC